MHDLTVFGCKSMLTWVATSLVTCALAEEAADEEPQPTDGPIEEIIVTGSRLPFHPIASVTVLSREDVERGGATSIGDVLQTLPQNTGPLLNTNVNMAGEPIYGDSRGDGSVRIALRGHSTLVLLNGRRFPNSGADGADTSVDLNTLPISFVDRVEVLPSGASAIYGADAVGGVVNVITRRDLVGFTLAGSQSVSEHGDGRVTMGQAAAGLDLLGGTWMLGAEHVEQDGVRLDRRRYSEVPLVVIDGNGTLAPFSNRATPDGRFEVPAGNALGLMPGTYTRVEGATGQTAADYRLIDPAVDYFNVAPYNYAQTPNERSAFWLIGSRPLGEHVNVFVEGLVHHRESAQHAAPEPYLSGELPALADGSGGLPANHYYNPFGADLVRSGPPVVSRRLVELGNRSFTEEVDLWRVLAGLEGRIAGWRWTISMASSGSDATTIETGAVFRTRYIDALGPSGPDESGHIVCGVPDAETGIVPAVNVISDCVPVNLFGGAGSITPGQLDYLSPGPMRHTGTNEEQIAELVLNGRWGRLSGRDLHWVVGLDYRRETGSSVPDPVLVAENEGVVLTGAKYDSTELFLEGQLPLLRDLPFSREVDLTVGLRWSSSASFDSHLSWQAGIHWQPLAEWSLHANYADVFATPALWQLHDPQTRFQGFDIDPCGNDPTPEQRENCSANGVPGGTYVQDETGFEILAGGNPQLEPETGYSVTAGVSYAPRWVGGLALGVDFHSLEISDLVSQLSAGQVLFECAEHGLPQACDDIQRFPDGTIRQVSTFNENFGGRYETRAFDFSIEWAVSAPVGDLNARFLATYLERWDEQPFLENSVFRYAGRFDAGAMPRWRSGGTVDWIHGRWLASYSVDYIGSYTQVVGPGPTGHSFAPYSRRVEQVLYHDLEARFEVGNGLTVRAAITNLTDEEPPFVNMASPANTDPGTYRLLGRSYFLELRYDFASQRG